MEKLCVISALLLSMAASMTSVSALDDRCVFGVAAAKESAKAVSNVAVKLYQQIAKPDSNVIFSPVSIALALALVESGAEGGTKNEIQSLIGSQGSSDSSNLYQSLQHTLQINGENSRLSIANGLFYSESLRLKEDYVSKMRQCFETQVTQEPFAAQPEEARRRINQWVSNATADKIPELFKQGTIDAGTMAVLANAVYMKAAWQDRFLQTQDLPFYRSGKANQAQTVPFMVRKEEYRYASADSYETVELAYSGAPLSMFIILPKQRDGIAVLEKSLTGDQLISLFGKTENRQVALKLPKFTMRQSVDLKSVLTKLGLKQMFSDQANFSRLAIDPLKVSGAVHEAYIKVNENGTEAAAATGFMMVAMSMPMPQEPPVPFIADHPFLFAIVHKPTGAIAFMGKVDSVEK